MLPQERNDFMMEIYLVPRSGERGEAEHPADQKTAEE
jgi:hypothetical protein